MMDLSVAIIGLANATISVYRAAASTLVKGVKAGGGYTLEFTSSNVVVYPATDKDLDLAPEGRRTDEIITVLTVGTQPIYTARERDSKNPDIVIWNSKQYEVIAKAAYDSIANYSLILCARLENDVI